MAIGRIKLFYTKDRPSGNGGVGFGFIAQMGGPDVFMHARQATSLIGNLSGGEDDLKGLVVEFDVAYEEAGRPQAYNVRLPGEAVPSVAPAPRRIQTGTGVFDPGAEVAIDRATREIMMANTRMVKARGQGDQRREEAQRKLREQRSKRYWVSSAGTTIADFKVQEVKHGKKDGGKKAAKAAATNTKGGHDKSRVTTRTRQNHES
jgi:cold shock CspA family protein